MSGQRWSDRYWLRAVVEILIFALLCVVAGADHMRPSVSFETSEPRGAHRFLTAYSMGDEQAAEQFASPVYRQEWERRGLSLEERRALEQEWPWATGAPPSSPNFSYVGGLIDRRGVGHLLYAGRAVARSGLVVQSAWRVDVDAAGDVTWLELVYLFSGRSALTLYDGLTDIPEVKTRRAHAYLDPAVAITVDDTDEGYYVAARPQGNTVPEASEDVAFFAVDADGTVRPGTWTFGESVPSVQPYGPGLGSDVRLKVR